MKQNLGDNIYNGQAYHVSFDVRNTTAQARMIQMRLQNLDGSRFKICNFVVPADSNRLTFTMRYSTSAWWKDIEFWTRPMDADGIPLYVDNIDVQYKPDLSVTSKQCISPSSNEDIPIPSETELVNSDTPFSLAVKSDSFGYLDPI